ncbi:hypothetical protein GQ43DRAFT_316349 [Delitschia confertaspora ATCC 74209]|uniref:CUE domain-containing protein n=1 Tax=Delitschia confertaspora ATCC 74209 TaxID=1513339 RepID=A0A9P4JS47_9PLEO|nr:hypothetical protein GQ43DRAFT_316349 [Delitschia confertaspora ATCC 74209]
MPRASADPQSYSRYHCFYYYHPSLHYHLIILYLVPSLLGSLAPHALLPSFVMSEKPATEKSAKTGTSSGAESPTTARPLDFDDDAGETLALESTTSPPLPSKSPKPGVRFQEETSEIPPPKPPRPISPQQQAENTLIEAFPDIEAKVIKAVLLASGGKVEPAFNALLSMSDPNFKAEEAAPPPQPPRPSQQRTQLEADELYARQLAEHYQTSYQQGHGSRSRGEPPMPQRRKETGLKPNELYDDREHSFFDDDLPIIKENVRKGFLETQSKVNKWITDFKRKIDGDDDDDDYATSSHLQQQRRDYGPSQSDQLYGIRKSSEQARRSADRERYDTDNRMLGDDFEALELHDNEAPTQPKRPQANPDLFKPTPVSPPIRGPVDEVDALYRNPSPSNQLAKTTGKKWQPLTSVAPHPEPDDHDPFSLGDSDDDEAAKTKDVKAEDTERLKRAAEGKEGLTAGLTAHERSGSVGQKDHTAEELLKETK